MNHKSNESLHFGALQMKMRSLRCQRRQQEIEERKKILSQSADFSNIPSSIELINFEKTLLRVWNDKKICHWQIHFLFCFTWERNAVVVVVGVQSVRRQQKKSPLDSVSLSDIFAITKLKRRIKTKKETKETGRVSGDNEVCVICKWM